MPRASAHGRSRDEVRGLVFALLAAVASVAAAPIAARAAESPTRERPARPGPALRVGMGSDFAGFGAQALFYVPIGASRFTVAPTASVGFIDATYSDSRVVDETTIRVTGFAAGVTASYGYRHRLSANLGYGMIGAMNLPVQNLVLDGIPLYGAFLQAGYEFVGVRGFVFRACPLGVSYTTSRAAAVGGRWGWAGSLGLGWKIW